MTGTKQVTGTVKQFIPNAGEVSDLLTGAVLPLTGGVIGWFAADFIGIEDGLTTWFVEQATNSGKPVTPEAAKQMELAVNGLVIAVYSVLLLVGLGLWGSSHDFIGSILTGIAMGMIANKIVDVVTGKAK